MSSRTEWGVNPELRTALEQKSPAWRDGRGEVWAETREGGNQPDVVVRQPGASPVYIEAKYDKSAQHRRQVEQDALKHLGTEDQKTGRRLESVIAVLYPTTWQELPPVDFSRELRSTTELQWALYQETSNGGGVEHKRLPEEGWIKGSVSDLADIVEMSLVSASAIRQAADTFEMAVGQAASLLAEAGDVVNKELAALLHQEPGKQTRRMVAALIANAFVFQSVVCASYSEIKTIAALRASSGGHLTPGGVADEWDRILEINYWPVFAIARDLLREIPTAVAGREGELLEKLSHTAEQLLTAGLSNVQSLTGQMLGELISDRKFLATFYTRPESAALLAEMGVLRLDYDWADEAEKLTKGDADSRSDLRVADLACGTGTLLSAAYRRLASRVRRAGVDDATLHKQMMEQVLIGLDIMPAAAHLTATMLSSVHPAVTYEQSRIGLLKYGEDGPGEVKLGALDLLDAEYSMTLFGHPGQMLASTEEKVVEEHDVVQVQHGECRLVVMNPPFTRPTNHKNIKGADIPVPSFAGFNNSAAEQKQMSSRLKKIYNKWGDDRVGNGNAGLGSNFFDLLHRKLTPGGTAAIILPFSVAVGESWQKLRNLLVKSYEDVVFIGIAAPQGGGKHKGRAAFSADTGMAELIIVATKRKTEQADKNKDKTDGFGSESADPNLVRWVSLEARPASDTQAILVARAIASTRPDPYTSQPLYVGDTIMGRVDTASINDGGLLGIYSQEIVSTAFGLSAGELRLHRFKAVEVPITVLGNLGKEGPYHLDVATKKQIDQRAPLLRVEIDYGEVGAALPMLFAHGAKSGRESQLLVEPDNKGQIRPGRDDDAAGIWKTATRLHINVDWRLNSQPLPVCFTAEPCLGGRAWPSFIIDTKAVLAASPAADSGLKLKQALETYEQAVTLWANTTLGLMTNWLKGNRTQSTTASTTIERFEALPVLDVRTLTIEQLGEIRDLFEKTKLLTLLPANKAYRDPNRQELDKRLLCDVLGWHTIVGEYEEDFLEALKNIRMQWCSEPSVHGGKSTAPHKDG